jgi:ADP-heptose:LPS heptosyltransferase
VSPPLSRAGLFRLAGRLMPTAAGGGAPRRLLVVKPDHMGDVLLASPALHVLRQLYPRASITLAVGPRGEQVAHRLPAVDSVVVVPFPGLDPATQAGVLERWSLLVRLARRWQGRFDAAVLLRDDYYWGAMLLAAARIPARLGVATPLCSPFLSRAVPVVAREPAAAQHLRVVAGLTEVSVGTLRWAPARRLRFTPHPSSAAAATREAAGMPATEPYLLLHPGSGAAVKLWTAEGWAAVLRALRTRLGLRTLVVAGEREQHLIPPIVREASGAAVGLPLPPDLDLLAALIRDARLALGVDSGPLHLAAAVDVPSVRLYGPTDPHVFGPWADPRRHRSVSSNLLCAPCHRLNWDTLAMPWHPCVRRIAPGAVVAAALAALQGTPPLDTGIQLVPPGDRPFTESPTEVDLLPPAP